VVVVVRVLGAPAVPAFPADGCVGAAIELDTRAGLVGDFIPDLVDALATGGFAVSWAGVEPRVDRAIGLGFSETRLGLWANELERSLATSRADGLALVLLGMDLVVEGAAAALCLLATLRAEPTEEGFFPDESDFCERLSEFADLGPAETASAFFGGVSRVFGALSVCGAGSPLEA
jgi:hypothetical protein